MGTSDKRFNTVRTVIGSLEDKRSVAQCSIDSCKTTEERRKLGQFSTPLSLARDIITFGLKHLEKPSDIRFFDPAFGTGAFYSALLHETDSCNITTAMAVEIDPPFANAAKNIWSANNIKIINADFTKIEPDSQYNLIICNPPYVRHHLIDSERKKTIISKTESVSGVKLSGLAGLYCHFLLQSIGWMEDGAVAGWLIPSEFMDVNYGKVLKAFLLSEVELFRIHRFDPKDVQFGDALVSSAVVWFRNKKPCNDSVTFSFGGSLSNPQVCKNISIDTLENESKWTRFPCMAKRVAKTSAPKLKDYFSVKRGVATGGNDFFILEESKIIELGLPFEFFRPVLPSARYVKTTEIKSDERGNPILPQRLYLLDCRLSEEEIREKYPRLWQYLESGKASVGNGYICKNRKCWYFQEQREAPMYAFTYMGRAKSEDKSTFRFILNDSKATVTNSYLALYPKGEYADEFSQNPNLKRAVWEKLNNLEPSSLIDEGRVYGGGLRKIEPKELLNVDVPFIADIIPIMQMKMEGI